MSNAPECDYYHNTEKFWEKWYPTFFRIIEDCRSHHIDDEYFNIEVKVDKKIKKLQKDTKKIVKEEASLLKMDKKHDKIIEKAKKKLKGK